MKVTFEYKCPICESVATEVKEYGSELKTKEGQE